MKTKPAFVSFQIGTVIVTDLKPITKDLSHEVAAWSTTVQSNPGEHSLHIGWGHYSYGQELNAYVAVTGKVIKNFTPSLFGGVRIGTRDGSEEVGRPHNFSQSFNLLRIIAKHDQRQYDGNMTVQLTDSPELRAAIALAVEQTNNRIARCIELVKRETEDAKWGMVAYYAKEIEQLESDLRISERVRKMFPLEAPATV